MISFLYKPVPAGKPGIYKMETVKQIMKHFPHEAILSDPQRAYIKKFVIEHYHKVTSEELHLQDQIQILYPEIWQSAMGQLGHKLSLEEAAPEMYETLHHILVAVMLPMNGEDRRQIGLEVKKVLSKIVKP